MSDNWIWVNMLEIIKTIVMLIVMALVFLFIFRKRKKAQPKKEADAKYKANEEISQKAQYMYNKEVAEYRNTATVLDEETEAKLFAKAVEIQMLKSPATAQFCDLEEMTITKDNGAYIISGYVDSQNSYGAMIRTPYKLTVFKENGTWKNANKFISSSVKIGSSVVGLTILYTIIGIIITAILFL